MSERGAAPGRGFEISVEEDHVRVRAEPGSVVGADGLVAALEELFRLPAYRSEKTAVLWDFRGCETDLRYETMRKVSEFVNAHYDPGWSHRFTALVVDRAVSYGMARMYEAMIDLLPIEVQVFRVIEAARAWLAAKVAAAADGASRGELR
jgi:hypothetical protein